MGWGKRGEGGSDSKQCVPTMVFVTTIALITDFFKGRFHESAPNFLSTTFNSRIQVT